MIAVKLVMFSAYNTDVYLQIARSVLGHGIATRADAESTSDETHNMLCVAGLVDGMLDDVEQLYYAAYGVAADERDMPEIIQVGGLSHIWVDSTERGVRVAVMSGSLPAWRDAICRGCRPGCGSEVRKVYNKVYIDLTQRSLDSIFEGAVRRPQEDNTFLLEFKT